MKTVKAILTGVVFFLILSVGASAQSGSKVIAVINKADWCPVCKANGKRAMADFMTYNKDGAILFIGNNLTNDETKMKSAEELKKYGLDKVMKDFSNTGVVYFFNPGTKSLISKISISESDNAIARALEDAKKAVN
jgi:thiol:disulfide interchange protein